MSEAKKKYRFLMIQAFDLPVGSKYLHRQTEGPKESRLMNHETLTHLLADVEWDLHRGPLTTYGDWPVESREEFGLVAAGRLPIVREACESGKYDALVLLGGGEPGFNESREIARPFGMPVVSCAYAQMHYASMLGNKFSVIDLTEIHNMYYSELIVRHRMDRRCASIRNLESPFPRPPHTEGLIPRKEKEKILRGEPCEILESAVTAAVAASCGDVQLPIRRHAQRSASSRSDGPAHASATQAMLWNRQFLARSKSAKSRSKCSRDGSDSACRNLATSGAISAPRKERKAR